MNSENLLGFSTSSFLYFFTQYVSNTYPKFKPGNTISSGVLFPEPLLQCIRVRGYLSVTNKNIAEHKQYQTF